MAPRITKHRIWCKTCNEFELHSKPDIYSKKLICDKCETEYSEIKLRDIPEEKLIEQRERYREQQGNAMNNLFGSYLSIGLLQAFSETDYSPEIEESDAGQNEIDEYKRELAAEKWRQRKIKEDENLKLKKKFHNLGRNEKCLCGSGKKYKKCCWTKIQKL